MEDARELRRKAEADFERAIRTARAVRDESIELVWDTFNEDVTAARDTYHSTLRQAKKEAIA